MFGKLKPLIFIILLSSIVFTAQAAVKDSDADGIADSAEIDTYHTDPLKFDTDNDGFSDGLELVNKSNPLDNTSAPSQRINPEAEPLLRVNSPIQWYLARIAGIAALIIFTLEITFGLIMTSKIILKLKFLAKINTLEFHRALAWSGISLVILHFGALFFDDFVKLTPKELLLPFTFNRNLMGALDVNISIPVIIGMIAFYLMVILIATSELRNKVINIKLWRKIHYFSFVIYISFIIHGIFSGTDSKEGWMILIYASSIIWVCTWIILRIFRKNLFYPTIKDAKKAAQSDIVIPMTPAIIQPKLYTVKAVKKDMLNKRDLYVIFEFVEPNEMVFKPGQFVNLNVGGTTYRSYSIASPITDTKHVGLVVSIDHDGIGANYLKNINVGDETKLIGPSGKFMLPEKLFDELVFIATGTGVAPYIPMFYKLLNMGYKGKISLYFGARSEEEIFFTEKFEELKTKLNFKYKMCISQPGPSWIGPKGKVTELLEIEIFSNKQYFLCGHPLMIEDMLKMLAEKGVAPENIFHEKFTVSKKS